MTIDEKREWVIEYYVTNPLPEFVYIDDADAITDEAVRYVSDMNDAEIRHAYNRLKDTKKGKEITEYLQEIEDRYIKYKENSNADEG